MPDLVDSGSSPPLPVPTILAICDVLLGEVGRRDHRFSWLQAPGAGPGQWLPVDAYYPAKRLVVVCDAERSPLARRYEELVPAHGLGLLQLAQGEIPSRSRAGAGRVGGADQRARAAAGSFRPAAVPAAPDPRTPAHDGGRLAGPANRRSRPGASPGDELPRRRCRARCAVTRGSARGTGSRPSLAGRAAAPRSGGAPAAGPDRAPWTGRRITRGSPATAEFADRARSGRRAVP